MILCASTRLHLRRFEAADAAQVELYAGDADVAAMTSNIPHPYPRGGAIQWIEFTRSAIQRGVLAQYAVVEAKSSALIGCMSLRRSDARSGEAEFAYWIGKPFWGRGYATEAAEAALEHVRASWSLVRIWADVLPSNERSKRVLVKLGMTADGDYQGTRSGTEPVRLLRFRREL